MALFDKFVIGFSIFWLLMPLIAFAVRSLRREGNKISTATFWVSWGNAFIVSMMALVGRHISFYHAYQSLILTVIFLWVLVLLWNWRKVIERGMQKEIDEGRAPQISNDWAKPDKL